MKRTFFTLFFAIGLSMMLHAQWTSPGDGTTYTMSELVSVTDGTVTYDGNYHIHADLTIAQNDVLEIDNGFTKIFVENALITIQGSMTCINTNRVSVMGDPHFKMRFENATGCEVKKMYFSDGEGIKVIESEVSFIDTKFLYFTRDYSNAVIDFMNCNPTIEDCYFLLNEGAAISSPANGQGSPRILNNHIEENVTGDLNSPQINLGPGSNDTIYIVGNEIDGAYGTHRVGGISVADLLGTGATKVLVKDNVVKSGRYGYNQQGLTLSSIIVGNQFIDNNHEENPMNGGSGISIYGVDGNNKAVIRNNLITGNLWGITLINAADIDLGTEEDWGNNTIHDNGNEGVVYDLYNNTACDFMAVGNDWGTSDQHVIEDHIFHKNDNPSLGLITYVPYIGYNETNEIATGNNPATVVYYNLHGQPVNKESLKGGVYIEETMNATTRTFKKIIRQ